MLPDRIGPGALRYTAHRVGARGDHTFTKGAPDMTTTATMRAPVLLDGIASDHEDSPEAAAIRALAAGWRRDVWLRHYLHASANRHDGVQRVGWAEPGCDCTSCAPSGKLARL